MAQTASDAVRAQIGAYRTAWNTHQGSALIPFFTADADFLMGGLPAARGRAEIERFWNAYFASQEPNRELRIAVESIRILSEDVAIVAVETTTGSAVSSAEQLPARKARGMWLMRRQNEGWLIEGMVGVPSVEDRVTLKGTLENARTLRPHLRAFVDDYQDTFNRHDPSALSAFYREDADIIVRNQPRIQGEEAIREWWASYFSSPRPYRAVMIVDEIQMMSPDIALLKITATGALIDEGEETPVRRTQAVWIVVREASGWKIVAMRVLPSEDDEITRSLGVRQ